MSPIRVVTDSTSDIPSELAEEWDVHVVPCYVNFGTQSYLDQEELSREEFYERLVAGPVVPTTAAPPSGLFAEAYQALLDKASGIVSLHPPDALSALRQSALNGWELLKASLPFRALGVGQLSMGLGWVVIRAAQAARAGAGIEAIENLVAGLAGRVHLVAALSTVEYLCRSGRVGWARGTIGRLLRIRPLISLHQGVIASLGYARTQSGAIEQMLTRLEALGELECLTVLHSQAPDLADTFRQRLAQLKQMDSILTVNVTPILGTHVGPGGLGFVAIQRQ